MSQANVDFVRRVYDEWGRGNFLAEIFDPDVRIVWLEGTGAGVAPESVGLDEARGVLADWLSSWEHATITAEEVIDAGDDQVVAIATWHARGKASAVDTEWRFGPVWTIRDGRVTSLISHNDPADALVAAGVER